MRLFDLAAVSSLYSETRGIHNATLYQKETRKKVRIKYTRPLLVILKIASSARVFVACCGCKRRCFEGEKVIHRESVVSTHMCGVLLHAQLKLLLIVFMFLPRLAEDNEPCCVRTSIDQGFFLLGKQWMTWTKKNESGSCMKMSRNANSIR